MKKYCPIIAIFPQQPDPGAAFRSFFHNCNFQIAVKIPVKFAAAVCRIRRNCFGHIIINRYQKEKAFFQQTIFDQRSIGRAAFAESSADILHVLPPEVAAVAFFGTAAKIHVPLLQIKCVLIIVYIAPRDLICATVKCFPAGVPAWRSPRLAHLRSTFLSFAHTVEVNIEASVAGSIYIKVVIKVIVLREFKDTAIVFPV